MTAQVFILPRKKRTEAEMACEMKKRAKTEQLRAELARKEAVRDPTLWAMPGMPDEMVQRVKETW